MNQSTRDMLKLKKASVVLSIILCITLLFGTTVYANDNNNLNVGNLSEKSQEWLEWFNSLPAEEKLTVSYRPAEIHNNSNITVYDALSKTVPSYTKNEQLFKQLRIENMPTGGYEWPYNPEYWNEKIDYANCYAYSMNVVSSTKYHKLQPGELSGSMFTSLTE